MPRPTAPPAVGTGGRMLIRRKSEAAERVLDDGLISVESPDEGPAFANEDEEHEFWSTHSLGEGMFKDTRPVPPEGDDWLPPARGKTITRPTRK